MIITSAAWSGLLIAADKIYSGTDIVSDPDSHITVDMGRVIIDTVAIDVSFRPRRMCPATQEVNVGQQTSE